MEILEHIAKQGPFLSAASFALSNTAMRICDLQTMNFTSSRHTNPRPKDIHEKRENF